MGIAGSGVRVPGCLLADVLGSRVFPLCFFLALCGAGDKSRSPALLPPLSPGALLGLRGPACTCLASQAVFRRAGFAELHLVQVAGGDDSLVRAVLLGTGDFDGSLHPVAFAFATVAEGADRDVLVGLAEPSFLSGEAVGVEEGPVAGDLGGCLLGDLLLGGGFLGRLAGGLLGCSFRCHGQCLS